MPTSSNRSINNLNKSKYNPATDVGEISQNSTLVSHTTLINNLQISDVAQSASIVTHSDRISELQDKDEIHDTNIENHRLTIIALQAVDASHNSSISSLNSKIDLLEQKDVTHDSSISDNSFAINLLQTKDVAHDSSITTLNNKASSLEQKDASHDASILTLNTNVTNLQSVDATQNNTLTSHANSIASLVNNDTAQNTSIANNANQTTTNTNNIASLSSSLGIHSGQISLLQLSDTSQSNSISSIQNQITNQFTGNSIHVNSITADSNILNLNTNSAGSDIINVGTASSNNVINLGNSTSTVNIVGSANIIKQVDLVVEDKSITLNKNGAFGSGFNAGIEINEDSNVTGYIKTSSDRSKWVIKAPGSVGSFSTPSSFISTDSGKYLRVDQDGNTSWQNVAVPSSVSAGGLNGNIQYNSSGNFAGASGINTSNGNDLSVNGILASGSLSTGQITSSNTQLILNKGQNIGTSGFSGLYIEEGGINQGYVALTSDRSRWNLKAINGVEIKLPNSLGGANNVLATDGASNTFWTSMSSAVPGGNQLSLQYNNGGGTFAGSGITVDATGNNLLVLDGNISTPNVVYTNNLDSYASKNGAKSTLNIAATHGEDVKLGSSLSTVTVDGLVNANNLTVSGTFSTPSLTSLSNVVNAASSTPVANTLVKYDSLGNISANNVTSLSNIVNAASSSPSADNLVKYDSGGGISAGKLMASNRVESTTLLSPNGTLYLGAQSGSIVNIGSTSSTINLTGTVGNINANNITANTIYPTSIDCSTVSSTSGTINIATQAASIVNIGSSTSSVNITGSLNIVNVQDINVTDKNIVLNKNGAAASGAGCGIMFEEGAVNTGYVKVSDARNSVEIKPPIGAVFKTPVYAATSTGNLLYGNASGDNSYATGVTTNGIGDLSVGNRMMLGTTQNAGTLNVGGGLIALYPTDSTASSGVLFARDSNGLGIYTRAGLGLNATYPVDFSIGTVNGSALSVANSTRNVGILKDNAAYALDVNGRIRSNTGLLPNSNGTSGQVLTSDGIGNINWNNASAPVQNVRVIGTFVTGHVYDMLSTDNVIVFSVYYDGAPTINLLSPSSVGAGKTITIKDGTGYACQYPITLTTVSSGGLIDGSVSNTIQIANSFGSITLISSGTKWFVTDRSGTMGKFIAYQSTGQSVPDKSSTAISFNAVTLKSGMFNDNQFFSYDANNQYFRNSYSRSVIWSITANVRFTNFITSNDNALAINIGPSAIVSGATIEPATQLFYCNNSPFAGNPSATVVVPGGYYVWISCYQASGLSQPIMNTRNNCQIQIIQLG